MFDIIRREYESALTAASAACRSQAGQTPAIDAASTRIDIGMMNPVRGRAMRLVRRKCFGNVPKYK